MRENMTNGSHLVQEFDDSSTAEKIYQWLTRIVASLLIGTLLLIVLSITALFLYIYIFGIHIGTQAIPTISSIDLPGSRYYVILYDPQSNGLYSYGIFADKPFKDYGTYSLGPAHVDEAAKPTVQEEAPEVYRIDWGMGPNAPYAIIDLKQGRILEDSNPGTKRNRLFRGNKQDDSNCQ